MLIYANTYHSQKPDMGYVGANFIEKAFTYALSWLFGTSQLLNQCQDCSSSRCLCRCVILASDAKMSFKNIMTTIGIMVCYIHISVRLLRCSFYIDRQCEGLEKRDG